MKGLTTKVVLQIPQDFNFNPFKYPFFQLYSSNKILTMLKRKTKKEKSAAKGEKNVKQKCCGHLIYNCMALANGKW